MCAGCRHGAHATWLVRKAASTRACAGRNSGAKCEAPSVSLTFCEIFAPDGIALHHLHHNSARVRVFARTFARRCLFSHLRPCGVHGVRARRYAGREKREKKEEKSDEYRGLDSTDRNTKKLGLLTKSLLLLLLVRRVQPASSGCSPGAPECGLLRFHAQLLLLLCSCSKISGFFCFLRPHRKSHPFVLNNPEHNAEE